MEREETRGFGQSGEKERYIMNTEQIESAFLILFAYYSPNLRLIVSPGYTFMH